MNGMTDNQWKDFLRKHRDELEDLQKLLRGGKLEELEQELQKALQRVKESLES